MLTGARRPLVVAAVAAVVVGILGGCAEVLETGPDAVPGRGFGDVIVTSPDTTSPGTAQPGPADPEPATSYEVGDCLTWDPDDAMVRFEVVPCDEAHFAEVAGGGDLSVRFGPDVPFPATTELSAAVAEVCNPIVTEYLEAVADDLDATQVEAGVIPPTEGTWAGGDRVAWCTVGRPRQGGQRPSYTGRIADGTAT